MKSTKSSFSKSGLTIKSSAGTSSLSLSIDATCEKRVSHVLINHIEQDLLELKEEITKHKKQNKPNNTNLKNYYLLDDFSGEETDGKRLMTVKVCEKCQNEYGKNASDIDGDWIISSNQEPPTIATEDDNESLLTDMENLNEFKEVRNEIIRIHREAAGETVESNYMAEYEDECEEVVESDILEERRNQIVSTIFEEYVEGIKANVGQVNLGQDSDPVEFEKNIQINCSEEQVAEKIKYGPELIFTKEEPKLENASNIFTKKISQSLKSCNKDKTDKEKVYSPSKDKCRPANAIYCDIDKLEDNKHFEDMEKETSTYIKSLIADPKFDVDPKWSPIPEMTWTKYHRLETIHSFINDLEYNYPSICTSGSIGKSLEGRDLTVLKVSNSVASNSCVWIDAGIHAREWIAPAVCTYIANYLVHNFNTLPGYMTNKDWYFLPVVNPDGYEFSHTNNRLWRKNRAKVLGQTLGVDLNRNFSFGWGGRNSSSQPNHAFYKGGKAFSEPESCAVRDFLSRSGLKFQVYITLHSYGQVIMFPFACQDELCPDYIRLLEGGSVISKAIYETTNEIYKVGISRDVMYGAAGTSNDWSYGIANIPYCYLIELRSKQHKFQLPEEEIIPTGEEILAGVKALVDLVDRHKAELAKEYYYGD